MEAIQLNLEESCSYLYRLKDNEYDVRQKVERIKKSHLKSGSLYKLENNRDYSATTSNFTTAETSLCNLIFAS